MRRHIVGLPPGHGKFRGAGCARAGRAADKIRPRIVGSGG